MSILLEPPMVCSYCIVCLFCAPSNIHIVAPSVVHHSLGCLCIYYNHPCCSCVNYNHSWCPLHCIIYSRPWCAHTILFIIHSRPVCAHTILLVYCIPGRKSGILRIQYGHAAAAAAAEISFWTR